MHLKCEFATVFIVNWLLVTVSHGKPIDRCDFVHELKHFNPQIDYQQLNAWTCIAQYQSNFNTSKINTDASGAVYHGIFQISDVYWCSSNPQLERACKIRCDQLHDTFLKDDFDCIQKIYEEHQRIHGNGYSAWPIHQQYCSDSHDIIKDCLGAKKSSFALDKTYQQKDKTKEIAEKKVHKIYERCELARELYFVHKLPLEQISTWVCIAKHESNYNTSAIGSLNADGSLDHGLFQISDIYWCSPPGKGWVCGISCAKLENADISDDVACMKKIYEEHQRLSGDGFNAWSVYPRCKQNVDQYTAGCFDSDVTNEISFPMHRPGIFAPAPPAIEKPAFKKKISPGGGKVFSRCELAKELRYKHNLPKDQIHTWVCIAQTLSSFNTAREAPKNADGTSSHGLFQISDQYWCNLNGPGKGCNIDCDSLKDGDITDDVQCVQTIFNEHQKLFGNGFQAWAPYEHHCKFERPEALSDCFGNEVSSAFDVPSKPNNIFLPAKQPKIDAKSGKIYERCELAKELRNVHNIPFEQLHTWVCIANHESRFDTAAIGRLNADGSLDHGIFQISDIYWCSNEGVGKGCNAACSDFRNADISDDVRCVRKIYEEHQRLFGNGFHAWTVYEPHCRHQTSQYISDCFPNEINANQPALSPPKPVVSVVSNAVGDQGRAYERCELAKELRYRHNVPKDQIADWVCIALYSSNLATSAKGQNSHGLFQINDEYWCSNNGVRGKQCNLDCSTLEDSDITDDYQCARQIYDTHQKLYGNGFSAWNVYEPYCRGRSTEIIAGCFDDISITPSFKPPSPSYALNVNYADNQISNSIGVGGTAKKGKVYERCELARELRYKYNLPLEHIHTWVCIVQRESNFDTAAVGRLNADGSTDHGLFQISDIYWCSNSGPGKACSASCSSFRDANIDDDVQCIKKIFDEHQRLFENGFHAWTTYEPYCRQTQSSYTDDCFANIAPQKVENVTKKIIPTFVPFTTTTTTQKPTTTITTTTTVAKTLTPLNQFKYSTFAPFSPLTPTQKPTTKYPTATAQFVSYYTPTTTKRPSYGTLPQFTTEATTTTPAKLTFATAFPAFAAQTKPISFVEQQKLAILQNNFFTTSATPKPFSLIQSAGFPSAPITTTTTTTTTPKPAFVFTQSLGFPQVSQITTRTTPKPAAFALSQSLGFPNTAPIIPTTTTARPSFNLIQSSGFTVAKATTTTKPTQPPFAFIQPVSFPKAPITTTTTTPKPAFAFAQAFGFPKAPSFTNTTTTTTPKPSFNPALNSIATTKTTPKPAFAYVQPASFVNPASNFIAPTTTTPKPSFAFIQPGSFVNPALNSIATTKTTPKPAFAFVQPANFVNPSQNSIVTPSAPTPSSKFNIFDLYLGRLSTKAPERYTIPTIPPLPKQQITLGNPYAAPSSLSASSSYTLNTFNLPENYIKAKPSTNKPSAQHVQSLFQSPVAKIAQSLGVNTTYLPPEIVPSTPKPKRIFYYSFSGLTSAQP